jgi:general secretion pathway protein A
MHNRFAGFQSLRNRWSEHIAATMRRPVLIIDEAQEALTQVFGELRVLASKDLDSRQLLCVVFAGDARLPERLRPVAREVGRVADRRAYAARAAAWLLRMSWQRDERDRCNQFSRAVMHSYCYKECCCAGICREDFYLSDATKYRCQRTRSCV